MIADTNFILRALDPANKTHGDRARKRIQAARSSGQKIRVLAATVIEVAYVLQADIPQYRYDRRTTAVTLRLVVEEPAFEVEQMEPILAAIGLFEESNADLHACYLAACASASGERVLSFDRDLRKLKAAEEP